MRCPGDNARALGETVTIDYTWQQLLRQVTGLGMIYVTDTQYDESGRVTNRYMNNTPNQSLSTQYIYYPWNTQGGRLQRIVTSPTAFGLQDQSYTYDANGNIATLAGLSGYNVSYSYDDLNRLTGVTGSISESYSYIDATGLGLLTSKNGEPLTYSTSKPHAVLSAGGITYTYDANGNIATRGNLAFSVNAENQASGVTRTTRPTPPPTSIPVTARVSRARSTTPGW